MYLLVDLPSFNWTAATAAVGAVVGLSTLVKGMAEYLKQGAQKRTELFLKMSEKYANFVDICALLEHQEVRENVEALGSLPYQKKLDFVGFHEELALMMESGLIKPAVVHYMFGYYAIMCWESDVFWNDTHGLNRKSQYWALFRSLAERMQRERERFLVRKFDPRKYKL